MDLLWQLEQRLLWRMRANLAYVRYTCERLLANTLKTIPANACISADARRAHL